MRVLPSVVVMSAALLVVPAAHAQSSDKPRRLHLGLGVDALDHLGDQCDQDGDLVSCSKGALFFPFTFSASFQPTPHISLGGRFSAASKNAGLDNGHAPRHLSIWQLSFEPRFYPLGRPRVAPFVGVAVGYGSFRETSAEVPEKVTHESLLAGGAAGADFTLSDLLAIGAQVRLVRMDFLPGQEEHDGRSTYVTGKLWLSFGVQLIALLPV